MEDNYSFRWLNTLQQLLVSNNKKTTPDERIEILYIISMLRDIHSQLKEINSALQSINLTMNQKY